VGRRGERGTKWKRWLAFIEVRVSHLFSHGWLQPLWMTATSFFRRSGKRGGCTSDGQTATSFLRHEVKRWLYIRWTDSHLFSQARSEEVAVHQMDRQPPLFSGTK
jgi:hypothetical protein